MGLHSERSPCALPRVSWWVNTSGIWIHPEGSTRHRMGFRPTRDSRCLETCSCILQLFHSIWRGEQILRLSFTHEGFLLGSALSLGACFVGFPILSWMVLHVARRYPCALLRVGGIDEGEKLWTNCAAKTDKGFQPRFVIPLYRLRSSWCLRTSTCFSVFVCCPNAGPFCGDFMYPDVLLLMKGIFLRPFCT